MIGLWAPDAAEFDSPLAAQTWLNLPAGVTRMQTTIPASGLYKFAIADARGDGRPDFRYRARLLYAGQVSPTHVQRGAVLRIAGIGFAPGMTVTVGGAPATVLSYAVDELLISAPALPEGTKDIALTDSATGATAVIAGAVSYGGAVNDKLQLLSGSNPPVPVGAPAPNPFCVRVVAADGVTPVTGASVTFTAAGASVSLMPPNPVAGIAVIFHVTAYRSQGGAATQQAGEVVTSHNAQQVALSDSDLTAYSDGWGQASITPDFPADWGALRVDIRAGISGQAAAAGQVPSFTLLTLPYENPNRLMERFTLPYKSCG